MSDDAIVLLVVLVAAGYLLYRMLSSALSSAQDAQPRDMPQETARRPHRHRFSDEQVHIVMQMFPHVSRETIETDLDKTRSVEDTCDNLLRGRATIIPDPVPRPPPAAGPSSGSAVRPPGSFNPFSIPVDGAPASEAPATGWSDSMAERSTLLQRRKEDLLRRARE